MTYQWNTDEINAIIKNLQRLEAYASFLGKKMQEATENSKNDLWGPAGEILFEQLVSNSKAFYHIEKLLTKRRTILKKVVNDCYIECENELDKELKRYRRNML